MKVAILLLTLTASTSVFASIKYSCKTLGGKALEFSVDSSQIQSRLFDVKENGIDITHAAKFEKLSKNTFRVTIGGKVRIEKTGTTTYQQVVDGGKPGAINCVPSAIPSVDSTPKDVY